MTAKTGALKTPTGDDPKDWQCLTCEYVVRSATLPFKCPRCGASRVKFVIMGETGEGEGA
jgi:rubrerythrin